MNRRRPSPPRTRRFVLGLDFGTLSVRALLVDVDTGEELSDAVSNYRHGVIEEHLPNDKRRLPPETALQHPADYLEAMEQSVRRVMRAARVKPEHVLGIGTDFTSCTVLPTRADGTPLCLEKRWQKNPHAWVKLWKHHAAQPEADRINAAGAERKEYFVRAYGGRYSSEWFFSKLLETANHAPEVYRAAERYIEAGDWIVWQLCGHEQRCLSAAGFKAMWVYPRVGKNSRSKSAPAFDYPSPDFLSALNPLLKNAVREKMGGDLRRLGDNAGGLTRSMAARLGLREATPVAVGNIDAHVAVPACGVTSAGKLVMILGTSTCHLLLGETRQEVEGVCGVVRDGVVNGFWGYEAGQAGVGDLFAWYMANGVPLSVHVEAKKLRTSVYQLLEKRAAMLTPGESGLLALDWWNGCRSGHSDSFVQ